MIEERLVKEGWTRDCTDNQSRTGVIHVLFVLDRQSGKLLCFCKHWRAGKASQKLNPSRQNQEIGALQSLESLLHRHSQRHSISPRTLKQGAMACAVRKTKARHGFASNARSASSCTMETLE